MRNEPVDTVTAGAGSAPSVGEWLRISRDDLLSWPSVKARSQLPRLVRRLVAETAPSVTRSRFPAGAGVQTSGWDGVVECATSTRFVPAGLSGWELSVNTQSRRKAESDYDNRLGLVPEQERNRWAYVGVICRQWTAAEEFARAKSELREFREVRALNVDDIEAWLEEAPQTTVWMRELLSKPIYGVRTVSNWWTSWLDSTTVPIDGEIVLAGRSQQVAAFRSAWEKQKVVTVGGDVRRDEILAFIAAALHESPGSEAAGLGEVLYVDDPAAARRLLGSLGGVTMLLQSEVLYRQLPVAGGSDRVIVPVPSSTKVNIVLPAVDSKVVAERLKALGERCNVAWDLGALARRSLLALRRHYATQPGLFRPGWIRDGVGMTLRRGVLLNRWNETQPGDRRVVERFFGRSYATVVDDLEEFAGGVDDPPFALFDKQWHVVSAADTWDMIGSQLTTGDIDSFTEVAVEVLGDPDPLALMPTGERLQAMMDGVGAEYSQDLTRGIVTTLAIVGSSDTQIDRASTNGSRVAGVIVRKLVEAANADSSFKTWATLAPSLPLLAEAAPNILVDGFQRGLSGNPPLLAAMFSSEPPDRLGLDGPEPYVHFLAALKMLAWSPDHLGAVVAILGKLSELDPRRRPNQANRSLADVMSTPRPNTAASAEDRLDAIHHLRRVAGSAAWHLMVSMLPTNHMRSVLHPRPRYRDWEYRAAAVTHDEFSHMSRSIMPDLIGHAGTDPARWASLVKRVDYISFNAGPELVQELIENVVGGLSRYVETVTDDAARSELWSAMRAVVARHREFSHTPWALPESVIGLFDPLIERLTPQGLAVKYRWLFTAGSIDLGDPSLHGDRYKHYRALLARQVEAVETILEAGGWEALVDFTNSVEAASLVGTALAQVGDDHTDQQVLHRINEERSHMTYMASQYFQHRFGHGGWDWVDQLIDTNNPTPHATAHLLCATDDPPLAWTRADQLGDDVAHSYWERVRTFGYDLNGEQVEKAVHRLQGVGRHDSALVLLSRYGREHGAGLAFAELVAGSLETAKGYYFGERPEIRQDDVERLLQVLADHADNLGSDRVALIEWYYLPLLGPDPDLKTLHRALAEDPAFFVEIITCIYLPASQSADQQSEPSEHDSALADRAKTLLDSWRGGPGLDEEGRVDEHLLQVWIKQARHGLAEADRIDVGDDAIGEALASSPAESDGTWPSQPVRDLLEDLANDNIDRVYGVASTAAEVA